MKHGLIQPNGRMHELHMYQIEGLCKAMMETAIKDEKYAAVYEEKYKGKYTYFSEALEFCLHELGWMLYDPFVTGKDEDHVNVLFSNGEECYVTSYKNAISPDFDRKSFNNPEVGIKRLTDETVSYDKTLSKFDEYDDGIVTDQGYISSMFLGENLNKLSLLMILHRMIHDKELYDDYLVNRPTYKDALAYLTAFPNVIAVDRQDNGQFLLSYVSENDGRVLDFINELIISGRMVNYDPAPVEEGPLLVQKM